ncbi:MAG: hypothetical protein IPF92_12965, partial [Myxococcales bacterium]|nr:hypothetical protein [Myxococcales bacterium]
NVFLYRRQTAPGGAVVEAHAKNGGAQVDRVDVAESEIGYLLAGDRTAYVLGSSTTSLLTFVPGSTPRRATVSGKPITNLRLCGADDTGAYVTGNRATDGSSGSYVYRITPAGETVTLNPDNASPSNGECTVGKGIVYWPHYSGDKKGIRAYY